MAEWFKAHAWKACVGNTTVGSNPTLSASFIFLLPAMTTGGVCDNHQFADGLRDILVVSVKF